MRYADAATSMCVVNGRMIKGMHVRCHRVEAIKRLGWPRIDCFIFDGHFRKSARKARKLAQSNSTAAARSA